MLIGMQTSAYSPYQAYQAFSRPGRSLDAVRPSDDLVEEKASPVKERIEQEKADQEKAAEDKKAEEKENAVKEAREEATRKEEEAKEASKAQVNSLTGYTDAQIQRLYREGRISYQAMNNEISDRKDAREERMSELQSEMNKTDDAIISSMVQKTDIGLLLPEDFTLDKDKKLGLSA